MADDDHTDVLGDHVLAGDVTDALNDANMSVATGADFGPGAISSALDDADETNTGPAFGEADPVSAIEDHNGDWNDAADDVVNGNAFDGSDVTDVLDGSVLAVGAG